MIWQSAPIWLALSWKEGRPFALCDLSVCPHKIRDAIFLPLEGFMVLLATEYFGVEEEVTGELRCAACRTAADLQWQSCVFPSGVPGTGCRRATWRIQGSLERFGHLRSQAHTLFTMSPCFPLISLWQEERLSFELTRFQGAGLGCSSVFFSGFCCGL